MGKEAKPTIVGLDKMSIEEVRARKARVEKVFNQRVDLVPRIGFGKVDVGEAPEKVGKARAHVEDSTEVLKARWELLEREERAYERAPVYEITLMQKKEELAKISTDHYRGKVSDEEFEKAKQGYAHYASLPSHFPELRRGLERRRQEEPIQIPVKIRHSQPPTEK